MEPKRAAAEYGDIADTALHSDVFTLARHAQTLRQHGNLPGAVVDAVELVRHQRNPPRVGNDAADGDGAVVVSAGTLLEIGDVCAAQRARGRERDECDGEESKR